MRISAPFGQYVPVESPIHALEPRVKMGLMAAYTVMLFTVGDLAGLAVAAVLASFAVWASRVPPRIALRGVKTVSVLLAFTLAAQALRWNPATVSLLRVGPLAVDAEGLLLGVFLASRIVLLVIATSLLTLTTTPVELTDALESLMRPLGVLGVPVGDVAMMLSIALRFIPTTAEEAEKVIVAQSARGARLDEGGPLRRARAYVPVLVPLFVGLFRRADELATAMEARCYRGGEGRTRLRERHMRAGDWMTLTVGVTALVTLGVMM